MNYNRYDSEDITVENTVSSILENTKVVLKVPPNLSSGVFVIQSESIIVGYVAVNIYDITGMLVLEYEQDVVDNSFVNTFNLNELPKGIYTVILNNEGHIYTERIVIQ